MVVAKVHVVVDVVVAEVGEVEVTSPTGKVDICQKSCNPFSNFSTYVVER